MNHDFFKVMCQVCRALGTTWKSEELMDLVVDKAIDAMGVKAACLFMVDEEKDEFVKAAQKGLSEAYFHAGPLHVKRIVPQIESEGYLFARDAVTDPKLENHAAKKAEGIASLLSVPVKVGGKLVGVLSLYTAEPREFSADEIEFVTFLAEQGAMAIERARLLEQIWTNINAFLDVATKINSSLDIKVVLQAMTEDVVKAFRVKAASIRLLDEDKRELTLVASYGLSEKYLNKGPVSAEKSIVRALEGEPVVVSDATTDPGVQYRKEKKEEGIVSILCVPIKAKDRVIGAMRLYSARPHQFTEGEVLLATALAHQGGLAIQNTNMYLMLQDDMKELKDDLWSHKSWF